MSSMTMSAPASSAANASFSHSTSISIFFVKLDLLALLRASCTPPATLMWLSLMSIASSSPNLCGSPPPRTTAFFSNSLNPGTVFLVAATLTWGLTSLHLSTMSLVTVAMPLILIRKFSASLSPARRDLAGPETPRMKSPFFTDAPSLRLMTALAPSSLNTSDASAAPARTHLSFAMILPLAFWSAGTRSSDVMSPEPMSSLRYSCIFERMCSEKERVP